MRSARRSRAFSEGRPALNGSAETARLSFIGADLGAREAVRSRPGNQPVSGAAVFASGVYLIAAHLLKRSVRRSMFSSQNETLICTACAKLASAVGKSASRFLSIKALAPLAVTP